jgi:hypothetical protein
MDEATCATCPWWYRLPERVEFRWSSSANGQEEIRTPNDKGECRKYPPRPPRDFPMTGLDDWCGEHPGRALAGGPA